MVLSGKQWLGRSDTQDSADRYADIPVDDPATQVVGQFVWGGGFVS
jgi:hypothetical protein